MTRAAQQALAAGGLCWMEGLGQHQPWLRIHCTAGACRGMLLGPSVVAGAAAEAQSRWPDLEKLNGPYLPPRPFRKLPCVPGNTAPRDQCDWPCVHNDVTWRSLYEAMI